MSLLTSFGLSPIVISGFSIILSSAFFICPDTCLLGIIGFCDAIADLRDSASFFIAFLSEEIFSVVVAFAFT